MIYDHGLVFPPHLSEASPGGRIYKITNTVNPLLYIGATTIELRDRWRAHRSAAQSTKPTTKPLYLAMKEYGIDRFSIEEIEACQNGKVLWTREADLIRQFNTVHPHGYNLQIFALTDEQAAIVRYNYYQLPLKKYAEMYGLTVPYLSSIRGKVSWRPYKHVTRNDLPKDGFSEFFKDA